MIAWTLYLEELAKQDGAYREVSDTMRRIELVYSQAEDSSKRDHKVCLLRFNIGFLQYLSIKY